PRSGRRRTESTRRRDLDFASTTRDWRHWRESTWRRIWRSGKRRSQSTRRWGLHLASPTKSRRRWQCQRQSAESQCRQPADFEPVQRRSLEPVQPALGGSVSSELGASRELVSAMVWRPASVVLESAVVLVSLALAFRLLGLCE